MSNNTPTDVFSLPYAQWLEKTLQYLIKFPTRGICICATSDNGEVYVDYHNMSMGDKLVISGVIQQDAMLDRLDDEGGETNGTEEE